MEETKWREWRRQGIGASEVAALLGKCPFGGTPYKVWLSKMGRSAPKQDNFAMARGKQYEPVAVELASKKFNLKFEPAWHEYDKFRVLRASLDGDSGCTVLETKIPSEEVMLMAEAGQVPEHYMLQIQAQLVCSGRERAIFFCYQPKSERVAHVIVKPDLLLQNQIIEAAHNLWKNHVEKDVAPDLMEGDYLDCIDPLFAEEVAAYKAAKVLMSEAELAMETAKDILEKRLGNLPGLRGHGIKLSRYSRKGNINYKAIEVLKGLDLEPYRAKPISVFKIHEETSK